MQLHVKSRRRRKSTRSVYALVTEDVALQSVAVGPNTVCACIRDVLVIAEHFACGAHDEHLLRGAQVRWQAQVR